MENIKLTPTRKEIIQLLGFEDLNSILRYYPYRYDHFKADVLSMEKHNSKVTFEGEITSKVKVERITKGRQKTSFELSNSFQTVKVVLFNKFINTKFLYTGTKLVIYGKYNAFCNEIAVSSYFLGTLDGKEKYSPVYSLPSQIKDSTYKRFVMYAYEQALQLNIIKDDIPEKYVKKYKLHSLKDALKYIHNPMNSEELRQAYRYLKYEEFLKFCLLGSLKRKLSNSYKRQAKNVNVEFVKEFIYSLPFVLTDDQKNVLKEILDDLKSSTCMSRLLQGDVGSGKTIVALVALIANYTANYQGCIMVPTDILARQHYQSIIQLLANYNIRVRLLVSDMPNKEKNQVIQEIKEGSTSIVIGTHALIQENIVFKNLGLAVIDEQHRFGVKQRVLLKEKSDSMDILYMSATPIPRTLASTIYMDMDVSTIENYPYKERKIITKFINENDISSFKEFILQYLKSNQKVYVVCPSITDSTLDISNVEKVTEMLTIEFSNYNVTSLHGKLSSEEKSNIIDDFANNKVNILVSTTVIEVGINIKDANLMIIYNAERFGLAQLHQLRGRLARDGKQGYCYLLSSSNDEDVINRLTFISSTNNGFEISKYDLKRRGAGDMLGLEQSGKSPFIIANLIDDFNILTEASKDAKQILENEKCNLVEQTKQILAKQEQYVD